MIPAITEVNFPSYATLHQATVSLQEMDERTITTQVRIDGSVTPSFEGWELLFKGERFVLPTRTPQASKDNTTKNALVDLTFQSWAIEQLKHYFFVSLSEYETGKFIPDQYNASVILPLESFVQLFNRVLQYYFGTGIRMDLFGAGTGIYSTQPVSVEINKTYIWDVLIKFYELFGVRWYIEYEQATGAYVIKVGYAAEAITDHDFEYGYKGGLLKFERNVQDADVRNILLGRGGEKNLPYRYFKLQDPQNQEWAADPDAIPELANIYFDRLRDINFRWYVRGWMQNPHRDTTWDATHTFPQYTESQCPAEHLFAFRLGKTDAKFNPVEYVKDDASITKYGERWGAVEDNDEVFPTIQGMAGTGIGRVDECVDVSDIVTDDIEAAVTEAATVRTIAGETTITKDFSANEQKTDVLRSEQFTIPSGSTGNIDASWLNPIAQDGAGIALVSVNTTLSSVKAVRVDNGTEYDIDTPGGFPAGTYYAKITVVVKNYNTSSGYSNVTYGLQSLDLTVSTPNTEAWKPTFDIWVKNIWETTQGQGETDAQYAARVWEPILGDRVGNEAKLVFSDGFMSISEDYEFTIASYPVKDRSKSINGVQSEWKITLFKSDAEFKATGLYIPNATTGGKPAAGDHFFFIGIDMPFPYVTRAEELLNGATMTPVVNKTAALSDLADVQPTWIISLDKVRVHTLEDGEYGQTLADRLSAGATVRIKDSRFTGGQTLTLYVKSITYTWNEPTTGNPYLVPDIEVVLSDTVLSAEGTVTRVANELNVVKTTYAKSADIESAVRVVGNALFLKKTGESDRSSSPTQFASKVTSVSFRQGDIGGKGWGFYDEEPAKVQAATRATRAAATETEEKGNSVLEIDKLVVRKEMRVNSLVANQIAYVGGRQIVSAAAIECTQVVDDQAGYYCYFNQKQGTVANLFVVGDFAMGQMFDPTNLEVRYYKARVDEIGSNYILLSKTDKDGDGAPAVGDTIVQHGHESNTARQFVIVRDVIGGGYERMLSGLDAVDAEGDEYYFAGRLASQGPRWFVGDTAGEYAEWVNGRLNIKGTLVVRNADGTYQAMTDYMAGVSDAMQGLQAQIDGQIQSWSSGEAETPQTEPFPQVVDDVVDPTTANFPAEDWALDTDRERHFGDIYVDDSTGQGYRYTKRVKNGVTEYYWTRITDEEVAEAMRLARQANQGVAGLQYLRVATNNGATLVDGGLILSNLMALGQTVSQQFQVTAGINGIMNAGRTRLGGGLAAWFGGDISDKDDLDQGVSAYAKSVFRFDGSGYLAGGNIYWDQNGYGGIPGISWSRPPGAQQDIITIGANVMLESAQGSDSRVTDLITLVQGLSNMFLEVEYTVGQDTRKYVKLNPAYDGIAAEGFVSSGGIGSGGGGGGGGLGIDEMWESLTNTAYPAYQNTKIAIAHLPTPGAGLSISQSGSGSSIATSIGIDSNYKLPTMTEWGNKADASALSAYALTSSLGSFAYRSSLAFSELSSHPTTVDGYGITDTFKIRSLASVDVTLSNKVWSAGTTNRGDHSAQTECPTYYGVYLSLQYNATKNQGVQIYGDTSSAGLGLYYRYRQAGDSQVNYNPWVRVLDANNYSTIIGSTTYAPYNSAGYLPLSGGTMNNTNVVTNLNADLLDGNHASMWFKTGKADPNGRYDKPYHLVAEFSQNNASRQINCGITLFVKRFYPETATQSGVLVLRCRYAIGDTTPEFITASWSLNNGLPVENFILTYKRAGNTVTLRLYASLTGWNTYTFRKIDESGWDAGENDWSLYTATYGSNYIFASIPSDETQVLSTNLGVSNNSATATKLQTARTIWGQSFDGTGNVGGYISGASGIIIGTAGTVTAGTMTGATGLGIVNTTEKYGLFEWVTSNGNAHLQVSRSNGVSATYHLILQELGGNVGIGHVDTPLYKLHVSGGDIATDNYLRIIAWPGYGSGSASFWYDGTNTKLVLNRSIDVSGVIYSTTGIFSDGYVASGGNAASSDSRLKSMVETVTYDKAKSVMNSLFPKEWVWNEKHYAHGNRGAGLIAQQVEGVLPFAIVERGGYKYLNYDVLHAYEIALMQGHESRLERLERENRELRKELEKLRTHINS